MTTWPTSPVFMRKKKALFDDDKFVLDSHKRCCPCNHCYINQGSVIVTVSGTGCGSECYRAAGTYSFNRRYLNPRGITGCAWEWLYTNPDGLPRPDFRLTLYFWVSSSQDIDGYKMELDQVTNQIFFGGYRWSDPRPNPAPVCNGDNCNGYFSGTSQLPGTGGYSPCGPNCIATITF